MLDYAVLPPEVNSGRMYAGAGSAPMVAAAAAWDRLAATLTSTAQSYRAVIAELTDGSWRGPSSAAMAAAAEPYLAWMSATAAQAAQTANQARGTTAGYEAAFRATVPPPVVSANRAVLASLVKTNVFGQNSAAIAANQADYGEMWAQDATAMHAYAAHSAAAAPDLASFTAPPQTADPAAAGTQASAATQAAGQGGLADLLESFLNSPAMTSNLVTDVLNSPLVQGFEQLTGTLAPVMNQFGLDGGFAYATLQVGTFNFPVLGAIAAMYTWTAMNPWSVGLASSVSGNVSQATLATSSVAGGLGASGVAGLSAAEVSAGMGRAAPLGRLSVPPAWGAPPSGIHLTAASQLTTSFASLPETGMAASGGWSGGVPLMAGMANPSRGGESQARPAVASAASGPVLGTPGVRDDAQYRSAMAVGMRGTPGDLDELVRLRRAVAEMKMQRDALKRSAASVIKRVKRR